MFSGFAALTLPLICSHADSRKLKISTWNVKSASKIRIFFVEITEFNCFQNQKNQGEKRVPECLLLSCDKTVSEIDRFVEVECD